MIKHITAIVLLAASFSFGSASAQERYSLTLKDGAVVRLDQKTGAISLCQTKASGISCSMAADERTAWSAEIEVMANRIDLMEKRLATLEATAEGKTPSVPENKQDETASTPDAEDRKFDRAMEKAETFMRRMMGVIKELKGEATAN